ncbi:hypothetical protein GCM10009000_064710 [Halobacterium noricense]|uniref:Transposase n=1 Tax=Haladaptatus pallidirubidus TaxID=1008152 RepID=A0AAV3UI16_9EURY
MRMGSDKVEKLINLLAEAQFERVLDVEQCLLALETGHGGRPSKGRRQSQNPNYEIADRV